MVGVRERLTPDIKGRQIMKERESEFLFGAGEKGSEFVKGRQRGE